MSNDRSDKPARIPGREATARPLPKRFYEQASAGSSEAASGFAVLLDGRVARTPGRRPLAVPSGALAEALAGEWEVQGEKIDPASMPLTRLVNTALDGVATRIAEVGADITKYAGSDLVCYRADFPEGLVEKQAGAWDPVLAWMRDRHGARFVVVDGIMPVVQPAEAIACVAAAVEPLDPLRLTALHVMTTLMGSALLGLAVLSGQLTPEAAWEAAHVDEDWQIAEWGEDAEAAARRAARWQEMRAASALVRLLDG